MDGLLWFLVFGLLFFVMMRFGCGAHILHGRHGPHRERADAGPPAPGKDPVCGMEVAADEGYSFNWGGKTYRFCSRGCLDGFEAAPARFAAPAKDKT